jgi:osmotically-inducible protein OsmY
MKIRFIAGLLVAGALLSLLQGCFTVVAAGVATGAMASVDRRSLATQAEDETIEWKASARISEKFSEKVHVNYTSFNRKVLLTGEVPTAEARVEVERLVGSIANVQGIYNELAVASIASFTARSNDAYVTSKVKGRFIDIGKFNPIRVKVTTEAGVVYLMGLVTAAEAESAVWVARTTAGVQKVVKVMEIVTDAKARELDNEAPSKPEQPTTPGPRG